MRTHISRNPSNEYPDRSKLTSSAPANAQVKVSEACEWLVQHGEDADVLGLVFFAFLLASTYIDKLGNNSANAFLLANPTFVLKLCNNRDSTSEHQCYGSSLGHTIKLRQEGVGLVRLAKESQVRSSSDLQLPHTKGPIIWRETYDRNGQIHQEG
ncbi:hypothetical protein BDR05DRAFT_1059434 [Suillus weaverae]|nr:hypothetical protein BDR05DRAFT_1059434 [Suillus weaverae]